MFSHLSHVSTIQTAPLKLYSKSTYASLTAIPNYPNRLKHPRTTLYTIADAGKMGRGMFAANDISAGELILSRKPLCLMPKGLVPHEATPRTFTPEQIAQLNHENTEAIEELYNRMTPERRALFDDLFNSHLNDDSSRVRGIIRTNGYGTRKLDKDRHVGICGRMSYLNHRQVLVHSVFVFYLNNYIVKLLPKRLTFVPESFYVL